MVGIVIVNYNGAKFQNECIQSLLSIKYDDYKIIIVDNGSVDDSMAMLDDFKTDKIIKIFNEKNLGVAAGNNIGIKKSIEIGCDYTLLLNNDTVVSEDFLTNLILCDENVSCPRINFYSNQKINWFSGGKINTYKGTVKHFFYRKERVRNIKYVEYAPTCCLLIKNSVFQKYGFFDEEYFLYYDDVDFCYKLKKNGVRIRMVYDSLIYHKVSLSSGGTTSPMSKYYNNRNRFYFIVKNLKFKLIPFLYTLFTRKIIIFIKKDEWIKKALCDFKNGKKGIYIE